MKNVKRLLLIVCLIFGAAISIDASAETNYVYDSADLLTSSQEQELQAYAERFQSMWDMNFLVVTTDDAEGKSSTEYADDFYDAYFPETTQEDGVLYLIDMDNREIYISTSGKAISYMTDQRVEWILDEAYGYVVDGAYYETFQAFFDATEDCLSQGVVSDQYDYNVETGDVDYEYNLQETYRSGKNLTDMEVLISVIAGLVVSIGTCLVIVGKYQLKFEDFHYDAYTDCDVQLSVNEDRLVNCVITHRRIPRNNGDTRSSGGAGRSSVHHSSSGRSHGGGGRGF